MPRFFPHFSKKAGLAPESLVHVGEQKIAEPLITLIDYDELHHTQKPLTGLEELPSLKISPTTSWLNIDGLHKTDLIAQIGQDFAIHPLLLEDILNTNQIPKIEFHDDYIFLVIKMLTFDDATGRINSEQVSFILGPHYLLSFQENIGDVFDPVRLRLAQPRWRIRKLGPDYLLYCLLDSIIDHYFVVLEKMLNTVETLQDQVAQNPDEGVLHNIHKMKREMLYFRKAVWPVREVMTQLARDETDYIQPATRPYFRDVYDHTVQVIDIVETSREMVAGMLEVYLSSLSNKMNSIMKVLTIIATVFIPLTFIVGVYGMNFDHMPELHHPYGYLGVWGVILLTAGIMLYFFKKKKWF